jgi:2-methylcitrate dehydratase PrpD
LPESARSIVGLGFCDCIAVMFAGWDEPATRIIIRHVKSLTESRHPLSIDGPDRGGIALVLGVASHALDYDDTALCAHPSAVLVPAILTEAKSRPVDGAAMLAAYIGAYEVWADLTFREADSLHAKGWHPSATIGTVAAAAAVAVIRGMRQPDILNALGIAASMASGVVANFGTMTKPFQLASAVKNGITACDLAEVGLTAAPDALEHEKGLLAALSPRGQVDRERPSRFGEDWHFTRHGLNVKLYPVCYSAHRALDAAIGLKTIHRFNADEIASVELEIGASQATTLRNARPKTALDAKFSAEFAMAAAFLTGRCGLKEVSDPFVMSEAVQEFLPRVSITPIHEQSPDEPAHSPFDRVSVVLRDGTRLASPAVAFPRGHYRNPASLDVIRVKFNDCVAGSMDRDTADRLFDRLSHIESTATFGELAMEISNGESDGRA